MKKNANIPKPKPRKRIVVDAHSDIPTDVFLRREAGEHQVLDKWHYGRLKEGGISLGVLAIYVEARYKPWRSLEISLRQLEALLEDLSESQQFFLISSKRDLSRVAVEDKIGVLLDMEGAEPLESGPGMLHLFFRLGIRMLGATWNQRNALASGTYDETSGSGLTSYGRQILQEASSMGMMIDVSHMAPNGIRDTLELLSSPVIASHSGAKAVFQHPRNRTLSDEHIKGIAKTGGVIGVPAFPKSIAPDHATVRTVAEHVNHLLYVAGDAHVGIGADFVDHFEDLIAAGMMGKEWIVPEEMKTQGLWSARDIPNLERTLLGMGHSQSIVDGIFGGNFFRVFEKCLPQ